MTKFALTLVVLLLAACATIRKQGESRLVGEWRYADHAQSCHYVFQPDGVFNGDVVLGGRVVSRFRGRWSTDGRALFYEYIADDFGRIPPGTTDRDTLLTVEPDRFVIEAADGNKRVYLRERR